MANSRWQYVRQFEEHDACLRNTFMLVRLDGRGFSAFCAEHAFEKPNDERALRLMNHAALRVAQDFPEIAIAYGQSDEYSFAFRRDAAVFGRRRQKILSTIVSLFSAAYVLHWPEFMGADVPLKSVPQFDARIVLYPARENLADYFRWRQADCHINNLYNLCFWSLVKSGVANADAEAQLNGTVSKEKHELLFQRFGINYNDEPAMYRKGSVILRRAEEAAAPDGPEKKNGAGEEDGAQADATETEGSARTEEHEVGDGSDQAAKGGAAPKRKRARRHKPKPLPPRVFHIDIINQAFWDDFTA